MDALYATSVTETTLTFVVNATQSYVGEDNEQVLCICTRRSTISNTSAQRGAC
jgi:hypothetical protein